MRLIDCIRLAHEFSLMDTGTVSAMRSIVFPRLWEHRRLCREIAAKIGGEPWQSDAVEATNAVKAAIKRLRMAGK